MNYLGNASGNDTDTHFGDELDRDPGERIGALEVVDEFSQIFDRVDVVVRRRRDEANARNRVTRLGDFIRHFVPRSGTRRHFKLNHKNLLLKSLRWDLFWVKFKVLTVHRPHRAWLPGPF